MIDAALKELEEKKLDTIKYLDAVRKLENLEYETIKLIKKLLDTEIESIETSFSEDFVEVKVTVSDTKVLYVYVRSLSEYKYECQVFNSKKTTELNTNFTHAVIKELRQLINEPQDPKFGF